MRMVHKKELGCQAMAPVVIKEELRQPDGSAKIEKFWQLLGGKKGIKCELFERIKVWLIMLRVKFFHVQCTLHLHDQHVV